MTDNKAVMQQALQELVRAAVAEASECAEQKDFDALHAAKLAVIAIAQPEQPVEPVAWAIFAGNGNMRLWSRKESYVQALGDELGLPLVPLYAHPIAQPANEVGMPPLYLADGETSNPEWLSFKHCALNPALQTATQIAQPEHSPQSISMGKTYYRKEGTP